MPRLEVSGASIHYETDGQASAPALLLVHAGIANLRMWDPQIDALARDHFVVRFDTRGHGRTKTADVEFSGWADALALLDHLDVRQATVIGGSNGGKTGIDLAVESPDRVTGLVTVGSGPGGFPEIELTDLEDAAFDSLDAAYEAGEWDTLLDREVRLWSVGVTRDEAALDPGFVKAAYKLNRANRARVQDAPVPVPLDPPAYDRVTDVDVPALVTVGEFDVTAALMQQAYLVSAIPGADGYIFSDTAHLPSVEHPDEFQQVVGDWLAKRRL